MSLQLTAASYIYIHYALMNTKMAVVANAIVHKEGSLQWLKFINRLEFSGGQGLYKHFTRMSPSEFASTINSPFSFYTRRRVCSFPSPSPPMRRAFLFY